MQGKGGGRDQISGDRTMPRPCSPRAIRWRKGEIIGAGAYGRVYMGMNLDSGELLAVKQVLITVNNVTKEKAQAHIRELEEEVRLLRNLSHPNIVRYLGTAREEKALNILLEFVPGGSIASLLGKFGSFTEPVIRMYTRQLLLGLEYLHSNNILHRDIKGANILVDNKGCIKLADFGASKKVVELATISEAKSMKGTPYWMAPEVIRQTGHNWQADIWSVGCTVIEMATGKPPWSQQFQEVAALFHIGTTKSHPPIPEHLSANGKNFLLKCLQREPRLRPSAADLLQHPFVTEQLREESSGTKISQQRSSVANSGLLSKDGNSPRSIGRTYTSIRDGSFKPASLKPGHYSSPLSKGLSTLKGTDSFKPWDSRLDGQKAEMSYGNDMNCSVRLDSVRCDSFSGAGNSVRFDSVRSSYQTGAGHSVRLDSVRSEFLTESYNPMCEPQSFNPMSEPSLREGDGWADNPRTDLTFRNCDRSEEAPTSLREGGVGDSAQDDDDDVTESKIRAFLDEKALELKRLQTPLFEELYNIWNTNQTGPSESFIAPLSPSPARPPKQSPSSKSPSQRSSLSGRSINLRSSRDSEQSVGSGSPSANGAPSVNFSPLVEVPSPKLNEWKGLLHDAQCGIPPPSPSLNSSERQRLWKEELQAELEMKREEKRKLTRQASTLTNSTSSPNKDKSLQRYGSRLACAPPIPK
ncbi:mitogen-activated protein kinase kinase kinase ANP1 [Marchantia polymorpha subsp. ruderalis]|uniref:mitogen-activated protein kinase kinase kinase n=2 Tax=Marchantia polymorpha TaxID=3197 RepID=A0AAF6BY36_MARPO|nr:hypothetical protein MARPO_0003s0063 [Marchantia polymorpha]BBN16920.1 hypothetical protein Mp_7g10440 [Marchantia polymorpha subsp. ruderalis]|eukprot:PTQ49161.1 hypothetical protein MARPO_0003s0063 [Marchantia polymorpha]